MERYTTEQLAKLTIYRTRRTLLQALHNNQKKERTKRNLYLSSIWDTRFKFGKKWLFNKKAVNNILKEISNAK